MISARPNSISRRNAIPIRATLSVSHLFIEKAGINYQPIRNKLPLQSNHLLLPLDLFNQSNGKKLIAFAVRSSSPVRALQSPSRRLCTISISHLHVARPSTGHYYTLFHLSSIAHMEVRRWRRGRRDGRRWTALFFLAASGWLGAMFSRMCKRSRTTYIRRRRDHHPYRSEGYALYYLTRSHCGCKMTNEPARTWTIIEEFLSCVNQSDESGTWWRN